ncbi:hypothetical protein EYB25_009472 [Talaromyces marneffei]|nr:hypothetical protein EYB25_009472 [Talaromyces marneffei]
MGVITLASGPRPPRGSCSEETDSEEKRLAVAEGGQSRCSASKNGGSTRSVTALLAPEVILGLIQTEKMSSQDYYGQQQPHYVTLPKAATTLLNSPVTDLLRATLPKATNNPLHHNSTNKSSAEVGTTAV